MEQVTTKIHSVSPESLANKIAQVLKDSELSNIDTPVWKYITRKIASEMLGVSYMTLDYWDKKNILKKRKIGSKVFYRLEEIEAILEKSVA